jgi:hypothetical protein
MRNSIFISKYPLIIDDLKICCRINTVHDCKILHCDNDSVHNWFPENGTILNVSRTATIIVSLKPKSILLALISNYYKLPNNLMFSVCERSGNPVAL